MNRPHVAVLGATSHIARNLIFHLNGKVRFTLYSRSVAEADGFLEKHGGFGNGHVSTAIGDFHGTGERFDAIINCVGFGTPRKLRDSGLDLFYVTEKIDNEILRHLEKDPCVYVNFSSGVVYGDGPPASGDGTPQIRMNVDIANPGDAYRIVKLYSEAKHRMCRGASIFDLRIFGFFSRFIDLNSSYLVADMAKAVLEKNVFRTDGNDVVRDFVHPADLVRLIWKIIHTKDLNIALDVYSSKPISKNELISFFESAYGMKKSVVDERFLSPTGQKKEYFSRNHAAAEILSFEPEYSSLEAIRDEYVPLYRA